MRRAEPVGVTGLGALCAAGSDVSSCLRAIACGSRTPHAPTRFPCLHARPYPVFEVPRASCDPDRRPHLSATAQFALHAAREALEHAGVSTLEGLRAGVCIGTSVGASLNFLEFYKMFRRGDRPPLTPITRYLDSNPALAVARQLGAMGPAQTVTNACSSGTDAIGLGTSWIRQGLCDIVLAGGADELSEITYAGFIRLLITDTAPCRPFDRTRAGLNLGEGAGMIVLESEPSRRRRNARQRATIMGYGTAADAHHLTAPHPEGRGLHQAMEHALTQAGLSTGDIAFLNVHGTGTPNNDATEATVLRARFSHTPFIATKGVTGHTLGAAGALEAVFTMAHLAAGELPASPGHTHADPELGITPTTTRTTISGPAALSLSLAFGGNNSVLAVGRGKTS